MVFAPINHQNTIQNNDSQLYQRSLSALTSSIISSLPDDISTTIITPQITIDPCLAIDRLKEQLYLHNQAYHQILEQMADTTSSTKFKDLDTYIAEHESILTNIIDAEYPGSTM